jgi:hypothetical protein
MLSFLEFFGPPAYDNSDKFQALAVTMSAAHPLQTNAWKKRSPLAPLQT